MVATTRICVPPVAKGSRTPLHRPVRSRTIVRAASSDADGEAVGAEGDAVERASPAPKKRSSTSPPRARAKAASTAAATPENGSKNNNKKVVVIGGGWSGFGACLHLSRTKGVDVVLLDAAASPGTGLMKSKGGRDVEPGREGFGTTTRTSMR